VLSPGTVHVWRADLDGPGGLDERVAHCLSTAERQRAGTFLHQRDRRRFVARRGLLRLLLAGYVGAAPQALELRPGPHGKPELPWAAGAPPVSFSCSSSRGMALYAVAHGRRLGVDVEALRPLPEREGMALRCCSVREQAALRAIPASTRDAAFIEAWTRKEAYLKAVGVGLTLTPARIEVSLGAGAAPALLAIDGDAGAARRWSLRALLPADGYLGAVAVEGSVDRLGRFELVVPPAGDRPGPPRAPRFPSSVEARHTGE
jgi:4'-phosphopantetheinyl transferase